jgi:ankyrin repeat protein
MEDILELLLDYVANIIMRNDEGCTLLHLAAVRKGPDLVRLLLEHGAKTDERDMAGWTALHRACELGRLDTIIEHEQG